MTIIERMVADARAAQARMKAEGLVDGRPGRPPSRNRMPTEEVSARLAEVVRLYQNGTRPCRIADRLQITGNQVKYALARARMEGML